MVGDNVAAEEGGEGDEVTESKTEGDDADSKEEQSKNGEDEEDNKDDSGENEEGKENGTVEGPISQPMAQVISGGNGWENEEITEHAPNVLDKMPQPNSDKKVITEHAPNVLKYLITHFSDFQLMSLGTFFLHGSVLYLSGLPFIFLERAGWLSKYKIQVAEIGDRMKSGYYASHGMSSVKEDISRMCKEASHGMSSI